MLEITTAMRLNKLYATICFSGSCNAEHEIKLLLMIFLQLRDKVTKN